MEVGDKVVVRCVDYEELHKHIQHSSRDDIGAAVDNTRALAFRMHSARVFNVEGTIIDVDTNRNTCLPYLVKIHRDGVSELEDVQLWLTEIHVTMQLAGKLTDSVGGF